MIAHADARALLMLYRTTPDARVRVRANALLCAFGIRDKCARGVGGLLHESIG